VESEAEEGCVNDWSVAGTPQKDLDKMIESWRKNATAD